MPDPRPVDAGADATEQGGQQRGGDRHADQRNEHSAVADGTQEGHRNDDQGDQADRDGEAAEQHGMARRLHRGHDRVVVLPAVGTLLAPTGDDQQRVVDGYPETDQGDEELHQERHVREEGQPQQDQEGRCDRHGRDEQRYQREHGGEDERENRQGTDSGEQGLDQYSRPTAGAAVGLEFLYAGDGPGQRCRRVGGD